MIYMKVDKITKRYDKEEQNKHRKRRLGNGERAIKQSGTVKEKLTSQEIGEETFSGKVEEWVEAVHGVSKIDKKKAVEKMLAELKKRDRKKRAVRVWWTAGGSVAAAILVFFTLTQWLQWGKETSDEERLRLSL